MKMQRLILGIIGLSSNDSISRNLEKALKFLNNFMTSLSQPFVMESAAYIYRKGSQKTGKGSVNARTCRRSAYATCRETATPKTVADVAQSVIFQARMSWRIIAHPQGTITANACATRSRLCHTDSQQA